jgi:hypothetical protein
VVELRDGAPRILGSFSAALPPEGYHGYGLVDLAQGRVVDELSASTCSIEDELWATIYAVVDDRLEEITLIDRYGADAIETRRKTRVDVLRLSDDLADRALADAAMARHVAERAARERRAEWAGADRVASIAGASDDLGFGPDVARAQARLRERVARYGDTLSANLLRTLVAFAVLCRAAPAAIPAISAFARACRCQCCDLNESWPSSAGPVADASHDPFLRRLIELEKQLRDHAPHWESVDATGYAHCLRQAAAWVHEAAALLAGSLPAGG